VKLSVAIIHSEEDGRTYLPECLASLPVSAEVVLVETAEAHDSWNHGDIVPLRRESDVRSFRWYYERGRFSFAEARNVARAQCVGDWILSIDADERLLPWQHEQLLEALEGAGAEVGGIITAVCGWSPIPPDGKPRNDGSGRYDATPVMRLFRNDARITWKGSCHEQILPSIVEAGLVVADSPFILHHVGYEVEVPKLIGKARRNLALLARDHAEDPNDVETFRWLLRTSKLYMNLTELQRNERNN
jgi:hypothetical protein